MAKIEYKKIKGQHLVMLNTKQVQYLIAALELVGETHEDSDDDVALLGEMFAQLIDREHEADDSINCFDL